MDGDGKHAATADQPFHVVGAGFDEPPDLRPRIAVIHSDRHHPHVARGEIHRFQQRRTERQEMGTRPSRAFRKDRDRLRAFKRLRDGDRLILGAFAVGSLHVERVVLVGEPVDERVAQLVLRNEGRFECAREDQDVEPTRVIGDDERVGPRRGSDDLRSNTKDPGRSSKKAARPWRPSKNYLRKEMDWGDDAEKKNKPRDSQNRARVQPDAVLSVRD